MKGIVFDIKHYALHDGPGIRTTVFLKGCPLGCWWCHNPESRSGAITRFAKQEKVNELSVDSEEIIGKHYTVAELIKEVTKDDMLHEESGGGVTISGGEPFYQHKFLIRLLRGLQKRDIHTCVDTTGHTDPGTLKKAAKYTDLFLYDLKHFDDRMHIKYTGVSNRQILDNLKLLDELDKEVEIRYPLIPGLNDDEADLYRMFAFLDKLNNRYTVNILPYHKIGSNKYQRFNIEYKMEGIEKPSQAHIHKVQKHFEEAGFEVRVGDKQTRS
jgi:pyruvate formate lyase activating enzyme